VVHVLEGGSQTREVPVNREALEHAPRVAQVYLSGIIKRDFPERKDEGNCKRCDVRKICCYVG